VDCDARVLNWIEDKEFVLGDTTFRAAVVARFKSTPHRFLLVKPRWAVEGYVELVERIAPRNIVELGILQGGSTAFLATVAQPDKLVAIELKSEPVDALERYLTRHRFGERVKTYYGVNQADGARVSEIVTGEFGPAQLDLVIDDASHFVDETRRSFNTLFPFLRPGGTYLIEDWSWAHLPTFEPLHPEQTPLTVFVFELLLACAYNPDMIEEITVQRGWVMVRRGAAELEPGAFEVSRCYGERGRELVIGL
jgi:Methyltransferase domain